MSCPIEAAIPHSSGGHQEDGDRDLQHDLAAIEIGQLAVDRRRRGRGQKIGGDDPGQMGDALKIGGDARQRGGDDGLVEGGEEHPEHQPGDDYDRLTMAEAGRRSAGQVRIRQCGAPPLRLVSSIASASTMTRTRSRENRENRDSGCLIVHSNIKPCHDNRLARQGRAG